MPVRLTIELPDDACSSLRRSPRELAQEMKLAAVCRWYQQGLLSQSKAASLAGLSRHDFLLVLHKYGISPFQDSADELMDGLDA